MSRMLERLAESAGLSDIYTKVRDEKRLSYDDGVRLIRSRELMLVGAIANEVREKRHGRDAYFVRNMHLNPTNICTVDCDFCGFYRPYREKEKGWSWTLERCFDEVRNRLDDAITEVHIVGGHNPDLPYDFYLDLMRGIHEIRPDMHIKAFTAAEYDFFHKRFKKPLAEVYEDFKAAGLGSLPGGGAEVLVERVRREIYARKLSAEQWLATMRVAHEHAVPGIPAVAEFKLALGDAVVDGDGRRWVIAKRQRRAGQPFYRLESPGWLWEASEESLLETASLRRWLCNRAGPASTTYSPAPTTSLPHTRLRHSPSGSSKGSVRATRLRKPTSRSGPSARQFRGRSTQSKR